MLQDPCSLHRPGVSNSLQYKEPTFIPLQMERDEGEAISLQNAFSDSEAAARSLLSGPLSKGFFAVLGMKCETATLLHTLLTDPFSEIHEVSGVAWKFRLKYCPPA
jgi:hypothetical protein